MTVRDLIFIEIEKTKAELNRLAILYNSVKKDAAETRKCVKCKTKNSHYDIKSNKYICSFCE